MRFPIALIGVLAAAFSAFGFTPSEPGLYAVFNTTNGEFTAKLHYDKVPLTVANFVGLAEGSIVSFDASGNPQKKRFYDGIIFHRVIKDFMNQGGSPNGLGTDGPGYSFPDEIDNTLFHSKAGALSMANSGANTNGSQFFVTAVPTTWLDGKHAVFGEVVEGMSVVTAINNVATDSNSKPTTAVVINSVSIVREGDAAKAFDATKWKVPGLIHVPSAFQVSGASRQILINRDPKSEYFIYASDNAQSWSGPTKLAPDANAPAVGVIDITASLAASGTRFVQIGSKTSYPTSSKEGQRLTLNLTGNPAIEITFGASGAGTYSFSGSNGTVDSYRWYDLGVKTQIFVDYSGLRDMQLYISQGQESGSVFVRVGEASPGSGDGFNTDGTFTITPAP